MHHCNRCCSLGVSASPTHPGRRGMGHGLIATFPWPSRVASAKGCRTARHRERRTDSQSRRSVQRIGTPTENARHLAPEMTFIGLDTDALLPRCGSARCSAAYALDLAIARSGSSRHRHRDQRTNASDWHQAIRKQFQLDLFECLGDDPLKRFVIRIFVKDRRSSVGPIKHVIDRTASSARLALPIAISPQEARRIKTQSYPVNQKGT